MKIADYKKDMMVRFLMESRDTEAGKARVSIVNKLSKVYMRLVPKLLVDCYKEFKCLIGFSTGTYRYKNELFHVDAPRFGIANEVILKKLSPTLKSQLDAYLSLLEKNKVYKTALRKSFNTINTKANALIVYPELKGFYKEQEREVITDEDINKMRVAAGLRPLVLKSAARSKQLPATKKSNG